MTGKAGPIRDFHMHRIADSQFRPSLRLIFDTRSACILDGGSNTFGRVDKVLAFGPVPRL